MGPRDLSRGRKPFERQADPKEVIGLKSHYTVERFGIGWAINVHRRGQPTETIICNSPGELNRHRQRLSADGLIGFNPEAA